ncbi:hypothetical protein QE152_g39489 [Popillia japonica]|uniref:DDE-1 domain-containing protein n=1 Tax=Popillia japonica TaxID=7064 RepID=A0AAW1HU37_POPJA
MDEPRNIFNADEFGLFFKLMPDKSYVFKGETCHGGKASKERLTVLACANSDGSEKLRLLVIEMEDPGSKRPLNVHDAIINIAAAWEAIKPETIQNWFKKAGLRNNEVDVALEEEELTILQGFPGYAIFDDNVAIRSIENLIEDVNNT